MQQLKFTNPRYRWDHPFKEGIRGLLANHFAPSLAKNFHMILEIERFKLDPKRTPNIIRQRMDDKLICEVHYLKPSGVYVYVCDVMSWWSKKQTELHLLNRIADKVRSGQIGQDWGTKDGRFMEQKFNTDLVTDKYVTPKTAEEIAFEKSQRKEARKNGKRR